MLLNSFIHDITEHFTILTLIDSTTRTSCSAPLTNIEELIGRVLVWRAGTQNSQAQDYAFRQLRWDDTSRRNYRLRRLPQQLLRHGLLDHYGSVH